MYVVLIDIIITKVAKCIFGKCLWIIKISEKYRYMSNLFRVLHRFCIPIPFKNCSNKRKNSILRLWGALFKREHALSRHSQIKIRWIIRFLNAKNQRSTQNGHRFGLLICRDNVSSLLNNAPSYYRLAIFLGFYIDFVSLSLDYVWLFTKSVPTRAMGIGATQPRVTIF